MNLYEESVLLKTFKPSKKMKKIILTLAAMAIAVSSFAQISVGAGYANNAQKLESNDPSTTNGFYVEGSYNLPIAGGLSIVPGVRYTFLGSKNAKDAFGGFVGGQIELAEHYVAVPVMAQYALDLGSSAKFLIFAGPTFDLGLASNTKASATIAGASGSTSKDNYKDTDYLKSNVFVGGGVGLQIGNFQIKGAYDFGLLNRLDSDNVALKDSQIRAGVAYLF